MECQLTLVSDIHFYSLGFLRGSVYTKLEQSLLFRGTESCPGYKTSNIMFLLTTFMCYVFKHQQKGSINEGKACGNEYYYDVCFSFYIIMFSVWKLKSHTIFSSTDLIRLWLWLFSMLPVSDLSLLLLYTMYSLLHYSDISSRKGISQASAPLGFMEEDNRA
jgi:hypothetical protein